MKQAWPAESTFSIPMLLIVRNAASVYCRKITLQLTKNMQFRFTVSYLMIVLLISPFDLYILYLCARACVLLSSIIDCLLFVTYATDVRWASMLHVANG